LERQILDPDQTRMKIEAVQMYICMYVVLFDNPMLLALKQGSILLREM
jgi:hypothetical protein